ncbi:unnamed protein product [Polarella glacialis]|uniref:Ubiquitin-like domain-containing protein n=1 Tax=Polarella glacialis TaxID=89957 RepID=A0A813K190_POLGL|nr:unnamed protein product [Polarella glacialis]
MRRTASGTLHKGSPIRRSASRPPRLVTQAGDPGLVLTGVSIGPSSPSLSRSAQATPTAAATAVLPQSTEFPQAAEPPQAAESEPPQAAESEPPQAAESEPPQAAESEPPQAAESEPPQAAESEPPQAAESEPQQAAEPPQAAEPQTLEQGEGPATEVQEGDSIQLTIVSISGEPLLTTNIPSRSKVSEIRVAVEKQMPTKVVQQLEFEGAGLKDSQTLVEAGILSNSTLQVIFGEPIHGVE